MAKWNYRAMRHKDESGEEYIVMHEVHYDEQGSMTSWSENPIPPQGETMDELRRDLVWMLAGLEKPVLDFPATTSAE